MSGDWEGSGVPECERLVTLLLEALARAEVQLTRKSLELSRAGVMTSGSSVARSGGPTFPTIAGR